MGKIWIAAGMALALAAGGGALAEAPKVATLSPEQVVAARQASFALSWPTYGALRAGLQPETDVTTLVGGARALSRWSKTMPTLFPAGTDVAPSKATPAVWTDRAGFEAAAAEYQKAVDQLLAAAQAGDKAGFAAAYQATGATCGACHDTFRQSNR